MAETNMPSLRRRVAGLLLLALWVSAILDFVWDVPRELAVAGLAAYVVIALVHGSRQSRWLCILLAGAIAMLGWTFGAVEAAFAGIERSLVFAAFLPTIVLVRATAELRPEIAEARRLFANLDPSERTGGVLFGCHVLSSVISIGIFGVLAPIISATGSVESRVAIVRVAIRSLCLGAVWSPFYLSVVLASQYITTVPLWHVFC